MRILMSSHVFPPSVGGLETVSRMLAEEFVRQSNEVRLITETPSAGRDDYPFPIWRRPSARALLRHIRWCDVYFHNNISLPRAWPLLIVSRPWVVAHHVWIPRRGFAGRAKRIALRFATGISVSSAIARHVSTDSTIIPNPYDESIFRVLPDSRRERDLVFVGRLVSDKGVDLLIAAAAALVERQLRPSVTIVGSGPEESKLRRQVERLGLTPQVQFAGALHGDDLTTVLNAHRIIVIPSVWQEPFGIVALEGMACGCIPVGSAGGGLRDAIGECGETFANGDITALTARLARLLRDPQRQATLQARMAEHLRRHSRAKVAAEYLGVFAAALDRRQPRQGIRTDTEAQHD
jgi:glycosyltransferase involved in cell wall biosynthesis